MVEDKKSIQILTMNTLAFMVCFAVWTMNGVLVTFLVDQGVFSWDKAEIGWLIGIPVLSGSIMRLPIGVLTDKYGGRIVYTLLMLIAAIPTFLLSYANSYGEFILGSLCFGVSGAAFAVGIAYTSLWFKKERQGTALGIFGVGNAGSALTSLGAPILLKYLTNGGADLERWRLMPQIYSAVLVGMAIIFFLLSHPRKVEHGQELTLLQRLAPLKYMRVWRFGLYYFVVFGGFVALAQWLIPYYVSGYGMSVAMAGTMAAIFSLPSGLIRAFGGWLSDKHGARSIMYWVFGTSLVCFVLLCIPAMNIESPGQGIMADRGGVVKEVNDSFIVVGEKHYPLLQKPSANASNMEEGILVFPTFSFWQSPAVKPGDIVTKKQLLARGTTNIYFQANVWIFTALVFFVGIAMGIGKAAVYKFIPEYYPKEVGVVGGIVGVLGGLGGFVCPIIFGYMLKATGIWTTAWMFFFAVTLVSHLWLHSVVRKIMREKAPQLSRQIEEHRVADNLQPISA